LYGIQQFEFQLVTKKFHCFLNEKSKTRKKYINNRKAISAQAKKQVSTRPGPTKIVFGPSPARAKNTSVSPAFIK